MTAPVCVEQFEKNDAHRVMLGEEEFIRLIRGGIVRLTVESKGIFGLKRHRVAIGLKDIGYTHMHMLIEEAEGFR